MKSVTVKNLIDAFQEEYYMYIPLTIILQSCIGSIAAMLILAQGTTLLAGLELTLCVTTSMGYNAAILAQAKINVVFWLLVISLIINTLLIAINIF